MFLCKENRDNKLRDKSNKLWQGNCERRELRGCIMC